MSEHGGLGASPSRATPAMESRGVRKRSNFLPAAQGFQRVYNADGTSRLMDSTLSQGNRQHPTKSVSWTIRLRNCLSFLFVASFPISIFLLPLWWNRTIYPRVVVSLTTTVEQLPHLQPTLESFLLDQSLRPNAMYLVVLGETDTEERIPEYVKTLQQEAPLEVLQPSWSMGPVSGVVAVMEHEALREETEEETRLILVQDSVTYPHNRWLIQNLVEASLLNPHAVVSRTGGNLQNHFRQVKVNDESWNRFPNVFLRPASLEALSLRKSNEIVDIVQSYAGQVIRMGRIQLDPIRELFGSSSIPSSLLQPSCGDLVWSALLEAQNVTKHLIPLGGDLPEISNRTLKARGGLDASMWIQAAPYLQRSLSIWPQYHFLKWEELTPDQRDAIVCEGRYLPDCTSPDACLPNVEHCPQAASALQSLAPP